MDTEVVSPSWIAPPWAETCTTDEDAVIYSLVLGRIRDLNGRDVSVELVQRDELTTTKDVVSISRQPAYLRVAGELITAEGAVRFAEMLMTANDLIGQELRPAPGSTG